ncbi:9263_t:CDS:2, partial [Rhizophagus irregularis]
LISYMTKSKKVSYCGFLKSYRDIIVTLTFSDKWEELDNTWITRFLHEGIYSPGFKDKDYEKEKENLISSHPEAIIEIPATISVKEEHCNKTTKKNIKLTNYCCDILKELDNKSNIHPFYKYYEMEVSDKTIKNPMDLFTINSKLENNQYRSTEEFEKDIRLIFHN